MNLLLALVLFTFAAFSAAAQTTIAIVNGKTITVEELSAALSDLANQGVPQSEILNRAPGVLRELMVERLVEEAYAKGGVTNARGEETNSDFALRRAERARRRVLVDTYLRAKLVPASVSQEEVDKYVRDNPDYFKARKTYHFSELSIAAPSETLKQRLNDELKEIAALRAVRPQRIDVLVDWLNANKFAYTHSKQWRGGEQVPRPFLERLKLLDAQPSKVSFAEANGVTSLVVLYGAYEDPANPAHMQQSIISQVLGRQSRDDQMRAIGDDLIAKAKVQIFEENIKEALRQPGAQGRPAPVATTQQKVSWTAQFALLLLAPFAGWAFFRRDHIAAGLTMQDSPGRHFSHSLEGRLFVIGGFAVFVLGSAAYVLQRTNVLAFPTDAAAVALAGVSIAAVLALLVWKAPPLNRLSDYRWALVGTVAAAQLVALVLNW